MELSPGMVVSVHFPEACDSTPQEQIMLLNVRKETLTGAGNENKAIKKSLFICELCSKEFSTRQNRDTHLRRHSGEKPFSCQQCGKKFTDKSSLLRHTRSHNGEKLFKCKQCPKCYSQSAHLKHHTNLIHANIKPFSCEQCEASFPNAQLLKRHKRVHTGEKQYSCEQCQKTFASGSSLAIHTRSHTGVRPYKCTVCEKSFFDSTALKTHGKVHSNEKPFKCDICVKKFKARWSLKKHKESHNSQKEIITCSRKSKLSVENNTKCHVTAKKQVPQKVGAQQKDPKRSKPVEYVTDLPYKCKICEKQFRFFSNLTRHFRIHSGTKPYKCLTCSKSFSQSSHLKMHMMIHNTESADTVSCPICCKQFTDAMRLQRHTAIHSKERRYACANCDKIFLSESSCNAHQRKHTGEKPFQCQYCDRMFSYNCALKRHVRSHTGEKPYPCDICDKSFVDSWSRTKHMGCHSTGQDFSCNLCAKIYTTDTTLKQHVLEEHTTVKSPSRPMTCSTCHRTFDMEWLLQMHVKNCDSKLVNHKDNDDHTCELGDITTTKKDNSSSLNQLSLLKNSFGEGTRTLFSPSPFFEQISDSVLNTCDSQIDGRTPDVEPILGTLFEHLNNGLLQNSGLSPELHNNRHSPEILQKSVTCVDVLQKKGTCSELLQINGPSLTVPVKPVQLHSLVPNHNVLASKIVDKTVGMNVKTAPNVNSSKAIPRQIYSSPIMKSLLLKPAESILCSPLQQNLTDSGSEITASSDETSVKFMDPSLVEPRLLTMNENSLMMSAVDFPRTQLMLSSEPTHLNQADPISTDYKSVLDLICSSPRSDIHNQDAVNEFMAAELNSVFTNCELQDSCTTASNICTSQTHQELVSLLSIGPPTSEKCNVMRRDFNLEQLLSPEEIAHPKLAVGSFNSNEDIIKDSPQNTAQNQRTPTRQSKWLEASGVNVPMDVEESNKQFKCGTCRKSYALELMLQIHQESTHHTQNSNS